LKSLPFVPTFGFSAF
jgi:hypothetical protein